VVNAGYLTRHERFAIDLAIRHTEHRTRFEVSAFIGDCRDEPRSFATALHASMVAPHRSLLMVVDPGQRVIEMVTGRAVAAAICDACAQSSLDVALTEFAHRKLASGLVAAIRSLADRFSTCRTDPTRPAFGARELDPRLGYRARHRTAG
jgi:hypothetical protein